MVLVDGPRVATAAEEASWQALRDEVRIVVRPMASPSAIGLFGLAGATLTLAGLQLGWVADAEADQVALVLIGFAFVAQIVASIFALLQRDVVVATAMCVLALTWLTIGLVLFVSEPGARSDALGLLLLLSASAMILIGATALTSKVVPALVFLTAGVRFALTAIYELDGASAWKTSSGWIGVALSGFAAYAAWALLIEGTAKQTVLPIGRRGEGDLAIRGSLLEQLKATPNEPGVRNQL